MKKDFNCQENQKVFLKEKTKTKLIKMEDIAYISCQRYLSTVHLLNCKTITVAKILKEFETELSAYQFVRINHNILVNIRNIIEFEGGNKRIVTIDDKINSKLQVSHRKLKILKESIYN